MLFLNRQCSEERRMTVTTSIIDPNRTTRRGHTCEFSESSNSLDILCRYSLDILNIRAHETIFRGDLMKPNARRQKEMFVSTMTELLWKVKTFSIKNKKMHLIIYLLNFPCHYLGFIFGSLVMKSMQFWPPKVQLSALTHPLIL